MLPVAGFTFLIMHPNRVLYLIIFLLILGNFYIIGNFELEERRWSRLISCGVLGCYIFYCVGLKRNLLTGAFLLFFLSSLLSLINEVLVIRKINLFVIIVAYLLLILHVLPLVKKLKTDLVQKVIFVVILIINFSLLFILADMQGGTIKDYTQMSLLLVRGLSIIALMILAFSYSNRYSNTYSFYFLLAVLSLVLSDFCAFITYYLGVSEFLYPDRFFYLLGLGILVLYTTVKKEKEPVISEELL